MADPGSNMGVWTQMLPGGPSGVPITPLQTPQQTLSLQQMQMHLDALRRQNGEQNALRALFSNPDAINPKTGLPTLNALQQIYRISPQTGIDVSQSMGRATATQNLNAYRTSEMTAKIQDQVRQINKDAYSAEQAALAAGQPPDAAHAAGQRVYTQGVSALNASGMVAPGMQVPPNYDSTLGGAVSISPEQRTTQERSKYDSPVEITYDSGGGQTTTKMAQFNKDTRTYQTLGPGLAEIVDPTKVRKIGTTGNGLFGDTGDALGNPALHGDDYLKSLTPAQATQVKALAEGREPFPSGFSMAKLQPLIQAVSQYDPSFDAVNYNARSKTRNDFTSGKGAANISSFNTAIGHLGALERAGDALNNSWSPTWNAFTNFLETQRGDPRVKQFDTAAQAVASELTRAFRGTGGSLTEVEDWKKSLSAAGSPEQIRGVIKEAVDLLTSRINAENDRYQRGMGTTSNVVSLLTPTAQKTLRALPGGEDLLNEYGNISGSGGGNTPAASAAPPQATLPDEARAKLQEGKITGFQNGQRWTLRNGQPVRVQ